MFSSRSFTVSAFTVRSMIHLDFCGEGGELGNSQIGETHRTRCVGRHREFPCLLPACHSPQIPMSPCVTDAEGLLLSQARILEWVAFPLPGDNPGIEPPSSVSPALAGGFFTTEPPGKWVQEYANRKTELRTQEIYSIKTLN